MRNFFQKKILWQIFGGDKVSVDPYCFQVKIRCEHRPTKPQWNQKPIMQDPWALQPPIKNPRGFGKMYKQLLSLEEPPRQGYLSYILQDHISNQIFLFEWNVNCHLFLPTLKLIHYAIHTYQRVSRISGPFSRVLKDNFYTIYLLKLKPLPTSKQDNWSCRKRNLTENATTDFSSILIDFEDDETEHPRMCLRIGLGIRLHSHWPFFWGGGARKYSKSQDLAKSQFSGGGWVGGGYSVIENTQSPKIWLNLNFRGGGGGIL